MKVLLILYEVKQDKQYEIVVDDAYTFIDILHALQLQHTFVMETFTHTPCDIHLPLQQLCITTGMHFSIL